MHQPQNKLFICVAVIGEIRTKSRLLSKADATFVKTRLPIHILFLFASHRYENDSEDYVENRNTVITKINAIRLNIEYIEVTIDKYATQQIIDMTFTHWAFMMAICFWEATFSYIKKVMIFLTVIGCISVAKTIY